MSARAPVPEQTPQSEQHAEARDVPPRAASSSEPSWVIQGAAAGVIGAACIALLFLGFDLAQGRPFRTPDALGARILLGETLPPDAEPEAVRVVAYTALHGMVFVSLGLIASNLLQGLRRRQRRGWLPLLGVAGVLFASFEVFFVTFTGLMAPPLLREFGAGRIAAANLLAAAAMSVTLLRLPQGIAERPPSAGP